MQTKDAIRFMLTVSNGAVLSVIDQAGAIPTTFPTPNGGCHPLWVLGHLSIVEGMIPNVLFGEPNPVENWKGHFGENSVAVADPAAYPAFAEVRAKYSELRERNLKLLDSLSDEDLDRATTAPPKGREREFATFGSSFMTLALHQAMHRSHVTDALRAAAASSAVSKAQAGM
jgi:uncharacterized damage-inducible protein DinB